MSIFKCIQIRCLQLVTKPLIFNQIRCHNKHFNPKFKKLRAKKVIHVDLPTFDDDNIDYNEYTDEIVNRKLRKMGLQPVRPWNEKPMYFASTSSVHDPYLPPEGDGKISPLNAAGAKQKLEWLKNKTDSWKALRKIRKYDEDFEPYPDFIDIAEDVYKKAHTALANNNRDELIQYATEKCYVEMLNNTDKKTIRWKYLKALEQPKIAHIRTTYLVDEDNIFAQITVRFHTQQCLAVYDRFGRLLYGSEILAKDVLEYVVFEKHVVNQHSTWRVHGKIIPDWLPPREPIPITYATLSENKAVTLEQMEPETVQPLVNIPSDDSKTQPSIKS